MDRLQRSFEQAVGDVDVDEAWSRMRRTFERERRRAKAKRVALASFVALVVVAGGAVLASMAPPRDVVVDSSGQPEGSTTPAPPASTQRHPTDGTSRGRLGSIPAATTGTSGRTYVSIGLLDGSELRLDGPTEVVADLGQFQVATRGVLYCQTGLCGDSEVVADLRDREMGEGSEGRFVERGGELIAVAGPWLVSVPTRHIAERSVSRWRDDLVVVWEDGMWPRLLVADGIEFDPSTVAVEFTRGNDSIGIRSAECQSGMPPAAMPFEDGTEHFTAELCASELGLSATVSGSRQFVERVAAEVRFERG